MHAQGKRRGSTEERERPGNSTPRCAKRWAVSFPKHSSASEHTRASLPKVLPSSRLTPGPPWTSEDLCQWYGYHQPAGAVQEQALPTAYAFQERQTAGHCWREPSGPCGGLLGRFWVSPACWSKQMTRAQSVTRFWKCPGLLRCAETLKCTSQLSLGLGDREPSRPTFSSPVTASRQFLFCRALNTVTVG